MRLWLAIGFVALAALAASCGDGDSALEDLGVAVQATRMAEATIEAGLPTSTPLPTATPEPQVFDDIRELQLQARNIRSFFEFFDARLAEPDPSALAPIQDAEGNLVASWLADCCERQWESAHGTVADTIDTLARIRTYHTDEDPSDAALTAVPPIQDQLENLAPVLDALSGASTAAAARDVIASAFATLDQLDVAIENLVDCCGPVPPTPVPTPTFPPALPASEE